MVLPHKIDWDLCINDVVNSLDPSGRMNKIYPHRQNVLLGGGDYKDSFVKLQIFSMY